MYSIIFYFDFCDVLPFFFSFFFTNTATPEIYTFPYTTLFRSPRRDSCPARTDHEGLYVPGISGEPAPHGDRKSTRLNSSHTVISYAVFCLKKKKNRLNAIYT